MKRGARSWKAIFVENGSYKIVALLVTLILWVTILGRRDVLMTLDLPVEYLLPKGLVIEQVLERKVVVTVSGTRSALRRFQNNRTSIMVDLSQNSIGAYRAKILSHHVDVPFGVKVISVTPNEFNVNLIAAPN